MNIDSYMGAVYWAQQQGATALFCDLRTGEAFHFPGSPDVCRKLNAKGWYIVEDGTGRKYQTGEKVGVCRFYDAASKE